jgi:NAD(P)-dependent dehydrogenase (short-subunit alcohol dehydrogenase family)
MNILVTGGSSGLGKSIVEKLCSDKKNHIFFTYNSSIENSQNICSKYPNSTSIKCDFTNDLELNIFHNNFKKLNINILINNFYSWPKNPLMPGTFLTRNFHKMDENIFIDEFKNNIIPTILITQEAIKYFRLKKSGKIITILSSFLDSPTIGSSIYISNKNYLKGLAKVWAVENVKFNITSNTISPSFMLTSHTLKMDERLIDRFKNNSNELMTVKNVSDKISDFLNNVDIKYEHDISL